MPRYVHRALIELGQELNYPPMKGCCHGIALKWLEACLLNDEEERRLRERVEKIRSVDIKVLLEQINAIKTKVKKREHLTEEEHALLEIPAFYDGLILYHLPHKYGAVFNQFFHQVHVDEVAPFVASTKIDERGGLVTIHSEPGIYTKEELIAYLESLRGIIEKNSQSIGLFLTSHNHGVGLYYDIGAHSWTFMDINQWPPFTSDDSKMIAEKIFTGFDLGNKHTLTAFNTRIITTKSQKNNKLITQLTDLGKYHLNSVTDEIADRKEAVNLLYIASAHGHLEFVKSLIKALVDSGRTADLSLASIEGATPLYIAAQNGHLEVVDALIKALIDSGRGVVLKKAVVKPEGMDTTTAEVFRRDEMPAPSTDTAVSTPLSPAMAGAKRTRTRASAENPACAPVVATSLPPNEKRGRWTTGMFSPASSSTLKARGGAGDGPLSP